MSVIKYNSEIMEEIASSYDDAFTKIGEIETDMNRAVENIKDRWHGDDANNAQNDLNSIKTQIASIKGNIEEIKKMTRNVIDNFSQLKYSDK